MPPRRLAAHIVNHAKTIRLDRVIADRRIKLKIEGHERIGPCPRCGGEDRFAVNASKHKWNCRGCKKSGRDAVSLAMHIDGIGYRAACEALAGTGRWQGGERRQQPPPQPSSVKPNEDRSRIQRAQAIWNEGRDPRGTAVEQYLAARKLSLPPELCGEVLRFHPQCPWKDDEAKETKFIPCLLAAFTSIAGSEITAIHRIRLDQPDRWPKTKRKMLGIAAGAAIKLDCADQRLHIGEGLETCMAARQLGFKPAWALGSARFSKLAPLNKVHTLAILGERDEASREEANRCAEIWMKQNKEVYLVLPKGSSNDFNDYLLEAGQ